MIITYSIKRPKMDAILLLILFEKSKTSTNNKPQIWTILDPANMWSSVNYFD